MEKHTIINKIKKLFYFWNCHGVSREEMAIIQPRIWRMNEHMLLEASVISAVLSFLSFLIMRIVGGDLSYVNLCATIGYLLIFLCSKVILNIPKFQNKRLHIGLLCFFGVFTMSYGICIGVYSNSQNLTVLLFTYMIIFQTIFVQQPLRSNLLEIVMGILFLYVSYQEKQPSVWVYELFHCVLTILLSSLMGWVFGRQRVKQLLAEDQMEFLNERLYQNSIHDPLTGLYNRRKFHEESVKYLCAEEGQPRYTAVALFDIDFFKQYNDTYGHDSGDDVLVEISKRLLGFREKYPLLLCRWGGEEFIMLVKLTEVQQAKQVFEEMRIAVMKPPIYNEASDIANCITISIGATVCDVTQQTDWISVYKNVDMALYEAKSSGRNRTVMYG